MNLRSIFVEVKAKLIRLLIWAVWNPTSNSSFFWLINCDGFWMDFQVYFAIKKLIQIRRPKYDARDKLARNTLSTLSLSVQFFGGVPVPWKRGNLCGQIFWTSDFGQKWALTTVSASFLFIVLCHTYNLLAILFPIISPIQS